MSTGNSALQNSYGPEVTPYQVLHQQPLEFDVRTQPPEVVPEKGVAEGKNANAVDKPSILGIRTVVFWTVFVILVIAVLGIGIGIGLGVGLKHNGDSNPGSPSPTATITSLTSKSQTKTSEFTSTQATSVSTAVVTSGTHGLASNSCNFTVPRTYHGSGDSTFTEYCFIDWPNGAEAADGSGPLLDLARSTVYTFEDCMEQCVKFNNKSLSTGFKCTAVTYNSNLTSSIEVGKQGGNCFLKNKKGVDQQASAESACAALVF